MPPGIYELVGTQEPPETSTALRGVPARARVIVQVCLVSDEGELLISETRWVGVT